jgi:hypothetical protein
MVMLLQSKIILGWMHTLVKELPFAVAEHTSHLLGWQKHLAKIWHQKEDDPSMLWLPGMDQLIKSRKGHQMISSIRNIFLDMVSLNYGLHP